MSFARHEEQSCAPSGPGRYHHVYLVLDKDGMRLEEGDVGARETREALATTTLKDTPTEPESRREALYEIPGGATRSEQAPAYDLIPRAGQRREAKRWALGAIKHGRENWERSLDTEANASEFCREAFNHMVEHMLKMRDGVEPEDDHIGAIRWDTSVLAFAEEKFGKAWRLLGRA